MSGDAPSHWIGCRLVAGLDELDCAVPHGSTTSSYARGVDTAGKSVGRAPLSPGVLTAVAALGLVACTVGSGEDSADPSRSGTSSAPAACRTPTLDEENSFEASATGGEVNALVFGSLPPRAGSELKIVWRVTGDGDLTVSAERPDGSAGVLTFGPQAHSGSNFSRPGDEWGTGFLFDVPGCWQLEVRRGEVHARVPVQVVA